MEVEVHAYIFQMHGNTKRKPVNHLSWLDLFLVPVCLGLFVPDCCQAKFCQSLRYAIRSSPRPLSLSQQRARGQLLVCQASCLVCAACLTSPHHHDHHSSMTWLNSPHHNIMAWCLHCTSIIDSFIRSSRFFSTSTSPHPPYAGLVGRWGCM